MFNKDTLLEQELTKHLVEIQLCDIHIWQSEMKENLKNQLFYFRHQMTNILQMQNNRVFLNTFQNKKCLSFFFFL